MMAHPMFNEVTPGYDVLIRPIVGYHPDRDIDDDLVNLIKLDSYARYILSHRGLTHYRKMGPSRATLEGPRALLFDREDIIKRWTEFEKAVLKSKKADIADGRVNPYVEVLAVHYVGAIMTPPAVMHEHGRDALRGLAFNALKQRRHKINKRIPPLLKRYHDATQNKNAIVNTWSFTCDHNTSVDDMGRHLKRILNRGKDVLFWLVIRDYHLRRGVFWRCVIVTQGTEAAEAVLCRIKARYPQIPARDLPHSDQGVSDLLYGLHYKHLLYHPGGDGVRLMYYSF